MSRYVIKFSKEGTIRYISHLDLFRLFKRAFKRAGILLEYSQGFNPHPKMSFAQPLSLGYSSSAEYLEFETREPYLTDEILEKIKPVLPEGILVFSCEELPVAGKSLAALTESADYEVRIPGRAVSGWLASGYNKEDRCIDETDNHITGLIIKWLSLDRIMIQKRQKKSDRDVEVDIKPMIRDMSCFVDNNYIMITMRLAAGSAANLSPEVALASFCDSYGIQYDRAEVSIKRTGLYFREIVAEDKIEDKIDFIIQ